MPLNQSRAIGIIRYESYSGRADAAKNSASGYDVWRRLVERSIPAAEPRTCRRRKAGLSLPQRLAVEAPAMSGRRRCENDVAATVSVVHADLGSLTRDLADEYRGVLVQMAAGD